MKTASIVFVLLVLPAQQVLAQGGTVWRCGADGRSYSATPCAEGRTLEPAVAPSATEQATARQIALADQRLAARLQDDRLRREAAAQRSSLAGFRTTAPGPVAVKPLVSSTKQKLHRRPGAAGTSRAAAPSSRRAKG